MFRKIFSPGEVKELAYDPGAEVFVANNEFVASAESAGATRYIWTDQPTYFIDGLSKPHYGIALAIKDLGVHPGSRYVVSLHYSSVIYINFGTEGEFRERGLADEISKVEDKSDSPLFVAAFNEPGHVCFVEDVNSYVSPVDCIYEALMLAAETYEEWDDEVDHGFALRTVTSQGVRVLSRGEGAEYACSFREYSFATYSESCSYLWSKSVEELISAVPDAVYHAMGDEYNPFWLSVSSGESKVVSFYLPEEDRSKAIAYDEEIGKVIDTRSVSESFLHEDLSKFVSDVISSELG